MTTVCTAHTFPYVRFKSRIFPGFYFCLFFLFLFLSTKPCDILCIFKQLICALLYFYSSTYEHCCCWCCCCSRCCYSRKSFYQKRCIFVTVKHKKSTVRVPHGTQFCHVRPIVARDRKRRSLANFRSAYVMQENKLLVLGVNYVHL